MELKGSKTEQNLWTAFAGESQARNKYDYFASRAKKDGYEQIAAIFQETALNARYGKGKVFSAAQGLGAKSWHMKRQRLSRRPTTRWDELLTVR